MSQDDTLVQRMDDLGQEDFLKSDMAVVWNQSSFTLLFCFFFRTLNDFTLKIFGELCDVEVKQLGKRWTSTDSHNQRAEAASQEMSFKLYVKPI